MTRLTYWIYILFVIYLFKDNYFFFVIKTLVDFSDLLPNTTIGDEKMIQESSITILVIEDETDTRNLFLNILESEGFETIGAENGAEGIKQAQKHLPDLIICDIIMPDMDGYDVLNNLRQDPVTAIIPFIFLTGSDDKAAIRKGMELGADDYITKPSTIEELLRAIAVRLEKQALFKYLYAGKSQLNPESLVLEPEFVFPHWSQVKVVKQLSRGFEKVVERKIQVNHVVSQGRGQRLASCSVFAVV